MLSFPNCKINIGLYITARRPDGYHNLETVFYPVALTDVLEIVPAGVADIHLHGKGIAGNKQDNLIWKAYELMRSRFPAISTLDIHLLKNIPMGAGMGGGSADGAFMLRMLNDYYKLGLSRQELAAIALELGSDCPFFIYNTPQFATGRGEVMQPATVDLSAYSIQLICPQVHISTAAAFKLLTPKAAPFDLRHLNEMPIEQWVEYISNDFEEPVFVQHPGLANIKQHLYSQGAIYASMSGSGSTLYGIFEKGKRAEITSDLAFESHYIE